MVQKALSKTHERDRLSQAESASRDSARRPAPLGRQDDIIALQHAAGNQAVSHLLQPGGVGPMPADSGVPPIVQEVLRSGSGQPLDLTTRRQMEARFGEDFSQVRVHTDVQAAESAHTVNAQAYTAGRDVVFGAGEYQPETGAGGWLLVHELAHVLQQRSTAATDDRLSAPSDPFEQAAEAAAQVAFGMGTAAVHTATGAPPAVQLQVQGMASAGTHQLRTPVPLKVRAEMKRQIDQLRKQWRARLLPLVGSQIDMVVSLIWEYAGSGRDAARGGQGAPGDWADTFVELMLMTTYDRGVVLDDWTSLFDDVLQNASSQQRADIHKYLTEAGSRYATYEPPAADEKPSFLREVVSPVAWKALELFSLGIVDESLFDLSWESSKLGWEHQLLAVGKVVCTRIFNILTFGGGVPAYEAVVRYWREHPNDGPWTTLAGAIVAGGVAAFEGILNFFLPIQELRTISGQQINDPKTRVLRDPTFWERVEAAFGGLIKLLALAGAGKAIKARLGPEPAAPADVAAGESRQNAGTDGAGQGTTKSPRQPSPPAQVPPVRRQRSQVARYSTSLTAFLGGRRNRRSRVPRCRRASYPRMSCGLDPRRRGWRPRARLCPRWNRLRNN